jgi:membrane protein implicated in regulation of membrane protease activity
MSAIILIIIGVLIWRVATHRARRAERQLLDRSAQGLRGARGVLMCVHDDWAYWRLDGDLMRAPLISGRAELRHAHPVDVLACTDLNPADAIAVLDALDEAEVKYGRSSL